MKSGVKITTDNAQAILDSLKALTSKEVLIGIPAEDSEREDVPFGNAGIGYLNEYGSPAQNIPARPHLQPGVKSAESQTVPQLKDAALAAFDGNESSAEQSLERAGQLAVNGVRAFINAADFVPLADSTVEARARRGRKGAKAEMARRAAGDLPGTDGAKPLVDTGQYVRAITYVVRDKNAGS
ncbi:hypothetical protein [Escherichia sp. E1130]|uniref:hypothetical protein n=1 Tax=Escherichia sp. E1130 TaxID=2041645 RepID=UPI001080F5FA|nr:hypothetical protein [Escherichia sp. E1130]TGC25033.1 hypothetical protein CQJ27_13645 [Escherichia sp. E1130]TLI63040.1 hypothetical protein FEK66_23810 [Escherichia sp. E1130]